MTETAAQPSGLSLPSFQGRQYLRDEVQQALRAAVVSGKMRPGVVYSAPALAAEFGVSTTPVREAMLELAREGLVEAVRNKGFRVTELSEHDLDEITQLRAMIEPPIVRHLAERVGRERLEALRPVAREIEEAAERGDLATYLEADRRFHLDLLAMGENRRLVDIVGSLRAQTRLFGLPELAASGALVASGHEHAELLDLLIAGDADGAEQLMRRHIGHVRGAWAGRPED